MSVASPVIDPEFPTGIAQPPTVAFHPAGHATPGAMAGLPCPNCGSAAPKTLVLRVDVKAPDNPGKRLHLLRCPACTAQFYDDQAPPDYTEPALNTRGRVPFYIQQGAGVSLITRPLAQLKRPAGSAYMEVGCGFGFGLDFALNTKGWTGLGIDPAPLAALGRAAFGLPIELRYLRDDDEACGTMDVVMGSEVIEHVTSPSAFIRTLRAMLRPGGVLILTTPNGTDIDPATAAGVIVPLLSPCLHLVIQNPDSLRALLQQAGFTHVEVTVDSHSLVAFASDAPLDLEEDAGVLRRALRDHLARRAAAADPSTDLFVGFAGRALLESVNDGDMEAADQAWAVLAPGVQARFGLALDTLVALPPAVATCGLEEMATLVPLNLGGILYAHAIRRLRAGAPRPTVEALFVLSAEAAASMRRALGELAMEDGQTQEIEWVSRAEALLCAADAGATDVVARWAALSPSPSTGEAGRRTIAFRAFMHLVNAGRYAAARAFVHDLGLEREPFVQGGPLAGLERDVVFGLAMLDGHIGDDGLPAGDPSKACKRFARVRAAAEAGSDLWWAGLRGEAQALRLIRDDVGLTRLAEQVAASQPSSEVAQWAVTTLVNLGNYDAARAVVVHSNLDAAPFTQPRLERPMTDSERDTVFCLGVLDAQSDGDGRPLGVPAIARGRFTRVRKACSAGSGLWWGALRGELQCLDLLQAQDEAARLTADVAATNPDLQLPPDMLVRIGRG